MLKLSGCSTSPCTSSLWRSGSIAGVPAWLRTWWRPLGVMMPVRSCKGVWTDVVVRNGDLSRERRTTDFSNGEGLPYGASAAGVPCLVIQGGAAASTSVAPAE